MSQKKQYPAIDEEQPEENLGSHFSADPNTFWKERKIICHYNKWTRKKHSSINPYVLLAFFILSIPATGYLLTSNHSILGYLGLLTLFIGIACFTEFVRKDARQESYIAGYKRGTFEMRKK